MARRRSSRKSAGILPWLIGAGAAWVMFGKPSGAAPSGTAQASVGANPISSMITSLIGPSNPAPVTSPSSLSAAGQSYYNQLLAGQGAGWPTDQLAVFVKGLLAQAAADPAVTSADLAYLHSASGM